MADTKKSEVVITCNAQQPKAAVRAMETELKRLQAAYKQLSDAGKAGTERAKQMAHEIKELSIAVKEGKANMDKIVTVTNNLSNSSLSQLQRALRQVKKEMGRVSTDSPKLDDLRQKYKAITDQIKILQGEMVNIQKHMGNLSQTSDAWLSRAINQQKQLVAQTDKNSNAYQRQVNVLHQLQAEQANRAFTTVSGGGANAEALRAARANLVSYRDQLGKGGIMPASGNVSAEIERINTELKKCDEQLDVINGKEKKIELTTEQIAQKAEQIGLNPQKFTPKEIKTALDDVNKRLQDIPLSEQKMRSRLISGAKQLQAALDGVDRKLIDINVLLRPQNLKAASFETLQAAAKQLEAEIAKLNRQTQAFADKQKQLKAIRAEIDKSTVSVKKHASAWQTAYKNLVAYVGLFAIFNTLKQHLTEVIKLNLSLSDQLADIRKVSGLSMESIRDLSKELAKIDTRNSLETLNELAYRGSKLGLGQYGVSGLVGFTNAAAQINMALHEDMGDEAIGQLAKMAEVMGDIKKLGVEKSLLSAGSAIFQLAATSTASGSNIMEFSKRLLGLGKTANLTTDEILALGSAADSMALMPEVASTAFNKFISTLQSKYGQIGKAVGIPPETLKSLLEAGQTMDAIVLVLKKMNTMGGLNKLMPIMGDLGSEGARLTNVFASMAANIEILEKHLDTSRQAFAEATAITAEFNIQNETSEALVERAANLWEKAFVNTDGVDNVHRFAEAWYEVSKSMTTSEVFMAEVKVLMWSLIEGLRILIGAIPALTTALMMGGLLKVLPMAWAAAATGVGLFTASVVRTSNILMGNHKVLIQHAEARLNDAQAAFLQAKANEAFAHSQFMASTTEQEAFYWDEQLTLARQQLTVATNNLAAATGTAAAVSGTEVGALTEQVVAETTATAATEGLTIADGELAIGEQAAAAASNQHAIALGVKTGATEKATAAAKGLKMAWGMLLIVGIVELITKLVGELKKANAEEERAVELNNKIANALATANQEYETERKKLEQLYNQLKRNWEVEDERRRLIDQMNNQYGDYLTNLINEKDGIDKITQAYYDATDALKEYYFYKQKEALKAELVQDVTKEGVANFIKLQQKDNTFSADAVENTGDMLLNYSIASSRSLMEGLQKFIGEKMKEDPSTDSEKITNQLWKTFTGSEAPGDWYMDLSKLPLVGGAFNAHTFRTDAQEKYGYLYQFVASQMMAANNEALIEHNFPGNYTPNPRKVVPYTDNSNNGNGGNGNSGLSNELQAARQKTEAVISNIKDFYTRQITALLNDHANGDLTEQALKDLEANIRDRMDIVLEQARRAIAGVENSWDKTKMSMTGDLRERDDATGFNLSKYLLAQIQDPMADLAELRKMILNLSDQLRKPGHTVIADVLAKSSGDANAVARRAIEHRQAQDAAARERNYTGLVDVDYQNKFDLMGFAPIKDEKSIAQRSEMIAKMLVNARKHIAEVIASESPEGLFDIIFPDWQKESGEGGPLEKLFEVDDKGKLKMKAEEFQAFYEMLIKYSDAYTDAQKKAYDEAKRRADFVFNNRPDIQGIDKSTQDLSTINSDQQRFGSDKNFTQQLGMSWNMDSDPEILRYRLLSEKARLYYQEMKSLRDQDKISAQQLTDAQRQMMEAQNAMADKVAAKFNERVQLLQSFSEPMATFAEGIGEYLESLSDDAEDSNEKMKNMAKTMLKAYAKMTLQLMAEDLTRRVTKQLYHRQEEADETLHQQTLLQIQQMYQALMLTAQQTGDAARLTQHSTSNAAELSEEATATTGKVGLGIAGGAAKIIGTLGFWGIPLIAVITALLMGLLSWAISAAFGGSDSGGADSGPNVKLATGMLTYDGGNVQSVGGGSTPSSGTTSPVLGTDGKVYNAKQVGKLQTGIVTQPIATMVNGQPSLVGEKGPEMVIGRETTAAMQMARPDLINEIVKFDKNISGRGFRTYDDGNLSDFTVPDASAAGDNMLTSEDIQGLRDTMAEFTAMMLLLQKNGLHVNKFGRGSVTQESADGAAFMRRNSGDRLWRKG